MAAASRSWGHEELGVEDRDLIAAARRAVAGEGEVVRATPHRTTLAHALPDGRAIFCKLRDRRPGDARVEWHWLRELPRLGFRAPQPILFARSRRDTAVCTLQAPGRDAFSLISDAVGEGRRQEVEAWVVSAVAPMLRRFHRHGLVFRDLYWYHLFAESLEDAFCEPTFIDVERVFRPRWRWRRWLIKDLAGLLASLPPAAPRRILLRGFRDCVGASRTRSLLGPVLRKAARIQRHRPRYG